MLLTRNTGCGLVTGSLWAGRDDEVIRVWQRYGIYNTLPTRAIAAVAQSRKTKSTAIRLIAVEEAALSLAPDNDDYRIGYVKTTADARRRSPRAFGSPTAG